jgi:hypothetical protein
MDRTPAEAWRQISSDLMSATSAIEQWEQPLRETDAGIAGFQNFWRARRLCPSGHFTLAQVAKTVEQSIELAKTHRVGRLLAVITRLDGLPSPTLADRFFIIFCWSNQVCSHDSAVAYGSAQIWHIGRS